MLKWFRHFKFCFSPPPLILCLATPCSTEISFEYQSSLTDSKVSEVILLHYLFFLKHMKIRGGALLCLIISKFDLQLSYLTYAQPELPKS